MLILAPTFAWMWLRLVTMLNPTVARLFLMVALTTIVAGIVLALLARRIRSEGPPNAESTAF